ncbi:MAG TPA: HEAT repeat domain-containing protein [Thermoanaerobaculia bacterium]|nr:HEAT repeat domain-containing protein [Thermoanaerobaculia bacterium]
MNVKKLLAAFAFAATLINPILHAAPAPYPEPADERSEREADLYEEGTDAIDDENWDEAVRTFARVAEMKGSRADGAVYWSAYALEKLGRKAEALKTIDGLKKAYPKSRWLDDAQALALELRQSSGERVSPASVEDDDLKMIAINSLMHTDPEKAFPLVEKVIRNGKNSKKVRERALFVLSQSSSAKAQALLADIARGNANPDLQKDAVRYLGISGSAQSRQLLADMYASVNSESVKKEIIRAFMLSGDKTRVLAAARTEKDPELREEAIRNLGIMGGRAELAQMYAGETNTEVKEAIIQALFISGDTDKMAELARTEKDPDLREDAIKKLGLMGSKTAPLLLSLYASETNVEVKDAVIDALFLQGNARALIDLSKKETNPELKREAMKKLSLMQNDEALEYMLQILNN